MILVNAILHYVINYKVCIFCQQLTIVMHYLSKDPNISKTLLLHTVVTFKPSSCMRQVHHLEKLIDILIRNTSTGEVSSEIMSILVLNYTSFIREMPKCGLIPIFFLNVFKDYTPCLLIMCPTRSFRDLFIF